MSRRWTLLIVLDSLAVFALLAFLLVQVVSADGGCHAIFVAGKGVVSSCDRDQHVDPHYGGSPPAPTKTPPPSPAAITTAAPSPTPVAAAPLADVGPTPAKRSTSLLPSGGSSWIPCFFSCKQVKSSSQLCEYDDGLLLLPDGSRSGHIRSRCVAQ